METKLTTKEQEFQKWFPEVSPSLWKNFNVKRIIIVASNPHNKATIAFEFNPMAPREGHFKVHINWSGKDMDEMRGKLYPILRAAMYGNFADVYTDNVQDLLKEIQQVYPNSTLFTNVRNFWPKGDEYAISVRD